MSVENVGKADQLNYIEQTFQSCNFYLLGLNRAIEVSQLVL